MDIEFSSWVFRLFFFPLFTASCSSLSLVSVNVTGSKPSVHFSCKGSDSMLKTSHFIVSDKTPNKLLPLHIYHKKIFFFPPTGMKVAFHRCILHTWSRTFVHAQSLTQSLPWLCDVRVGRICSVPCVWATLVRSRSCGHIRLATCLWSCFARCRKGRAFRLTPFWYRSHSSVPSKQYQPAASFDTLFQYFVSVPPPQFNLQ